MDGFVKVIKMSWEDILKADKEQTFLTKVKEVASKINYNFSRILARIVIGVKLPTYAEKEIEDARLKEKWAALSPEEKEEIRRKANEHPYYYDDWSSYDG